ncbi:MAG: 1-phosphofructokinase [Ruminococcaceae bacterium]|nr:1-phosphofructokinase [Oscillospiraceae bacterium]
MIYTVTLNPAMDKTVEIPEFSVNGVNRIASVRTDPGGKGINVSKVIKALGGESIALGVLEGNTGAAIEEALKSAGISCDFTYAPGETRTNLKIIDPVAHTHTDVNEPGQEVSRELLAQVLSGLLARLKEKDIVVFSGSVPENTPVEIYKLWTMACKEKGARVFLDASGELFSQGIEGVPYLVKPNRHELEQWAGRPLKSKGDLYRAGMELLQKGISRVVISLGEDGALFLSEKESWEAKGIPVPVGSTVGAGDAMVAALALCMEENARAQETVSFAMATAAANVMCSGTQAADKESVQMLLSRVECKSCRIP